MSGSTDQLRLTDGGLLRESAYVGGSWVTTEDGRTFGVTDPSTGAELARVTNCGASDARRAIEVAETALVGWRSLVAKERSALLRHWFDLIIEHEHDLARLMTAEQGKPLSEALGEVRYGASFIEWFSEEAKRAYGDVIPAPSPGRRLVVIKQPIGVVGCITPWNFPIAMLTRKAGPALAAGCTVVAKPASETPLCALALAELADRAGIPAGVFNVVPTSEASPVGTELTTNRAVRKISFTGSTEVGKHLMAQAAGTVKKVALELGGNAPFIVFDDADLDAAVVGAMASKFRNGGQTCVCANRILVQDTVFDEFAERLGRAVRALVVGPGADEGVTIGPLINPDAVEKVQRLVDGAVSAGATATIGGSRHELGGTYFEPTILTGVTAEMAVATEEIFGPVAPLFRFATEEEAVALANDTPFGLAAYFYARDVGRIWRVAEALEYGMVGINEGIISNEVAPFGGVKESGIGREGSHYGLDEFLEIKYLAFGGLDTWQRRLLGPRERPVA